MSTVNGFQVGANVLKYSAEALENYNTPDYSSSSTYAVGEYVMYQGKLYKCKTAITTAEAWTAAHWETAILSEDVSDLKSALYSFTNDDPNASRTLQPAEFVNGRYYSSDGTVEYSAYHIRTKSLIRVNPKKSYYVTILPASTFSANIVQYDKDGEYISGETMTSRRQTFNAKTVFIGITLWKGQSTAVSSSDVTSVALDTFMVSDHGFENDCIDVSDFVTGQVYRDADGKINADATYSRSKYLYRIETPNPSRLLINTTVETKIACFSEDFTFIDWYYATGNSTLPSTVAFIGLTVKDSSISSAKLYRLDYERIITATAYLELGGLKESTGANEPVYTKNPYSYKRTSDFIKIGLGKPFLLTFTGALTVYEFTNQPAFVKKSSATSGAWYFPDKTTELIKLESYVAPTLVSTPSITVGNKYSDGWGSEWTIESNAKRFYTDPISLDSSKKYLIGLNDSNVQFALEITLADGNPLVSFGFLNGEPIIDYLTYLDNASKLIVRGKRGTDFSSVEKPCTLYELTDNPNTSVTIKFETNTGSIEKVKNKRTSSNDIGIIYPVSYIIDGSIPTDMAYSTGLVRLPSNYSPDGEPVPVIYFAHGSSDYTTIDTNVLSPDTRYGTYIQYLVDEGYAVCDFYGWSNLMAFAGGGQWAGHIGMACVMSGLKYLFENYNLDSNHVYVTSKSLGGLQALNMATQYPVKAVAPLAPAVDSFETCLGYKYVQRKASFYDFGLDAGTDDVNIQFGDKYMYNCPAEFITALLEKPDATCGYNPAWNCMIDIDPTALITAEREGTSFQSGALNVANIIKTKSRIVKAPIKIWAASDDNAISYRLCSAFVQSIKNAGGNAVLRTMPDNTGGHHSVDTDENAPKVASITTKLGVTHTNVPLAYVEMVEWFRMFD